jgi:hypothetical protein
MKTEPIWIASLQRLFIVFNARSQTTRSSNAASDSRHCRLVAFVLFGTLSAMSLKRLLLITLFLCGALSYALAQDQGRRMVLEESLQSRYRLTILGGGLMGTHGGDNAIRRVGVIVILVQDGLYGSYDRGRLASNAIQNGKADVLSGAKDVALGRGEKFYVTAVYVGSDVVTMGLLSTRMIPGSIKTSQVWATANFFFAKDKLAQGDIEKIYSVIDQWLLPEGANSAPPMTVPPTPTTPVAAAPSANPVDLKPGMTHDEIVSALGTPLQDAGFADHRWLTYPGITITLEQGKLTSVDRNAQVLVPVRISSDPGGADVFLDGSFVSSTPAVLRLQAGTYKVAVKMSGYADWEREIKILPGAEVNLDARLSKSRTSQHPCFPPFKNGEGWASPHDGDNSQSGQLRNGERSREQAQ